MAWFRRSRKKASSAPPSDLWTLCPSCKAHIYKEEWESRLRVCPKCNFHDKLTCLERVTGIFDPGTFKELNSEISTADPLSFKDAKGSFKDKVTSVKSDTSLAEAVLTGHGQIHGTPAVAAIMDFRFLGGSLGSGTGQRILRAAEYALKRKMPYIVFSASGGARMQEGIISLMQMAKTCAGISRLNRERIPYISVITNPTFGGVSASYAMVGDLNIAEPGALVGFAGRRVIEQTIKQKLPADFQTAEYLLEHGFVDRIVNRSDMKNFLHSVLLYWNPK